MGISDCMCLRHHAVSFICLSCNRKGEGAASAWAPQNFLTYVLYKQRVAFSLSPFIGRLSSSARVLFCV